MISYRVIIPMLAAAAFPVTLKHFQVPTYYYGDVVTSADPADLSRLLAAGWIEAVGEAQELIEPTPVEA